MGDDSQYSKFPLFTFWKWLTPWLNNGNWTEWSAIWSEIIRVILWNHKYDFRPKLHSTQFSYHFIKSILKLHNFMALNFRFWCNVPRRTGLLEMAEPETLWHVIWHGKRCHVTKTHSCITSKQAVLEWERKQFDWRFRRLNQWWKTFLSSVVEAETSRCLCRRNLRVQLVQFCDGFLLSCENS